MTIFHCKLKYRTDATRSNRFFREEIILPKNLLQREAAKTSLQSSQGNAPVVVEMTLYQEELLNQTSQTIHCMYYIWLGKVTDIMDTVEIPEISSDSPLSNIFQESVIVTIQFYPFIRFAKDIFLLPKSYEDWNIIEHHAGYIENNLLRSMSLVTAGEELCIPINSSISAKLIVQKLVFDTTKDSESIVVRLANGKGATKQPRKEVGRISNQTQLIIQPIPKTISHSTINASETTTNSKSKERNWSQVLTKSTSLPLRVLPQLYRQVNTSSSHSTNISTQGIPPSATLTIDNYLQSDNYLDSFLQNPPLAETENQSKHAPAATNHLPWEQQDVYIAEAISTDNFKLFSTVTSNSSETMLPCDAFIHPLNLILHLEQALQEPLSREEFYEFFQEIPYPLICFVRYHVFEDREESRPPHQLVEKSLIRLYCTEQIHPNSILLSSLTRKAIGVQDYDFVSLEFIASHRPSLPNSIRLRPILWGTTTTSSSARTDFLSDTPKKSLYTSPDKKCTPQLMDRLLQTMSPLTSSSATANSDYTIHQVTDGFVRFLQQSSRKDHPYLLSHHSILSLQMPVLSKQSQIGDPSNGNSSSNSSTAIAMIERDFLVEFSLDSESGNNQFKKGKSKESEERTQSNLRRPEVVYLPLCFDQSNEWEEEMIVRAISLLQLEKDYPVKGLQTPGRLPNPNYNASATEAIQAFGLTTIGLEKLIDKILPEITCLCSPEIILSQLENYQNRDGLPSFLHRIEEKLPDNYLIVGDDQTGKTSLLSILTQRLQYDPDGCLLKVNYFDLNSLFTSTSNNSSSRHQINLPQILQKLQQLFEDCLSNGGPILLLLDNLDSCCPHPSPFNNSSSHNSPHDVVRDERYLVITSFLQQKLQEIDDYRKQKQLRAKELFRTFYSSLNNNSNSINSSLQLRANYRKEMVLSQYLQAQIIIIGTAQSLHSLDPIILGTNRSNYSYYGATFHQYFTIPTRIPSSSSFSSSNNKKKDNNHWKILTFYLEKEGIPLLSAPSKWSLPDSEITTQAEEEILNRLVEFRYGDYPPLVALIHYEISLRLFDQYHSLPLPPASITSSSTKADEEEEKTTTRATLSDILNALKRYLSLFTRLSSTTTASSPLTTLGDSKPQHHHQTQHRQIRLDRSMTILHHSSYFRDLSQQILEIIYYPTVYARLYQSLPIRLPKAIMLFGLPGSGKTFLAQTIGNYYFGGSEGSHRFYTIKGPQLLNKYIGESEKAIRELFQTARQSKGNSSSNSKSGGGVLIFFDEFEALAPKRGKDNTGITDRIVNQLLTFIDGVESTMSSSTTTSSSNHTNRNNEDEEEEDDDPTRGKNNHNIFIIIGTSRPDLIDAALLRPGRIETHLHVSLPSSPLQYQELLTAMMKPYLFDKPEEEAEKTSLMMERICQTSIIRDFTMADLQAMIDTAYLKAVHQQLDRSSKVKEEGDIIKVVIDASTLWQAFEETKPSLQPADRQFYEHIYAPFISTHSSSSSHPPPQPKQPLSPESVVTPRNGKTKKKDNSIETIENIHETNHSIDHEQPVDVDRLQKLSFR